MPAFVWRRNNFFWTSIQTDGQNENRRPGAAASWRRACYSAGATLTRTRSRSPGS
jgi:hypothetical protein